MPGVTKLPTLAVAATFNEPVTLALAAVPDVPTNKSPSIFAKPGVTKLPTFAVLVAVTVPAVDKLPTLAVPETAKLPSVLLNVNPATPFC